jgi:O-antigen ligase
MSTLTYDRPNTQLIAAVLLGVAAVGIAFGIVNMPWIVTGAVLGATVLAVALTAPLVLVAVMLMIGPVDLSFLTGGFKSLFPGLGGLDMNGIRLLGASAGFLAYITFEPRSRRAAVGPLGRLWLVFLAFAFATLAFSLDRLEGMRLLLKLAYPFMTFLIVIGLSDSRERVFQLMKYTLIAACVLTVIVNPILALNGGYQVDWQGFLRVSGLGKGNNTFAFYCTAMLMIVFTRFVLRLQFRYLLLAIVMVTWIALTVTRIAALASVLGLATVGVLAALQLGNRKILVGSAVAAAIIGAFLLPNVLARSLGFVPTPAEFFALIRNPAAMYESINWQGRQLIWAVLWAAFMVSPIVGRGMGSSTAILHENFPQGIGVAHNEYVRLGTETGLIGVALFGAAVVAWLLAAIRMSRHADRGVREFAIAAVAIIMVFAVISFTDNSFDAYTDFTQYIGFLMAGAVVSQADA